MGRVEGDATPRIWTLRSVGEQNNAFVAAAEESQNLYDSGMAGANFDAAVTKNV